MTATYVNPAASDKDAVRFLIGDTNPDNSLISDEEIGWLVTKWIPIQGTIEYVAAAAADSIAAKYAREASFSADGVSVSLANLGQQFRDLAISLRSQHKSLLVGGIPDVGGITPNEEQDPAIKPFDFGTEMHDNPQAGSQQFGSRNFPIEYNPGV